MKTIGEFFDSFESFHKTPSNTTIIHPSSLYEFDSKFIDSLKKELQFSLILNDENLEVPSALAKFAFIILLDSF